MVVSAGDLDAETDTIGVVVKYLFQLPLVSWNTITHVQSSGWFVHD